MVRRHLSDQDESHRQAHGVVVLVVVDEEACAQEEQSVGGGNEHLPSRASHILTYGSPFTMMHSSRQFIEGHAIRRIIVVVVAIVVVVVAPWRFRHARAAARQSARQPAGAGLDIASTTAMTATTTGDSRFFVIMRPPSPLEPHRSSRSGPPPSPCSASDRRVGADAALTPAGAPPRRASRAARSSPRDGRRRPPRPGGRGT